MSPRKSASNTRGKPFQPGNPGKPPGTRHRVTRAVEALLEGEAEGLTRKAIDMALAGDSVALRLCLERIAPAAKERIVAFELPAITTAEDAATAIGAVIRAVADGALAPGEAANMTALIERWRAAFETSEIERRLTALEEKSR